MQTKFISEVFNINKMKPYLKLFMWAGMIGCSLITLLTFLLITVYGQATYVEPNKWILAGELIMFGTIFILSLYGWKEDMWEKK